jgi:hypothetical protein
MEKRKAIWILKNNKPPQYLQSPTNKPTNKPTTQLIQPSQFQNIVPTHEVTVRLSINIYTAALAPRLLLRS